MLSQAISERNTAVVDVAGAFDVKGAAVVKSDSAQIAHRAADHLLERGFRHFSYVGNTVMDFSEKRQQHFCQYLADRGITVQVFNKPPEICDQPEFDDVDLGQWLLKQPRPLAVFACNDLRARNVVTACRERGIAVPEEVSVVGVDNDEAFCELTDPPLSSVQPNWRRLGLIAATTLNEMLKGEGPPAHPILIPPVGVVTRLSSEMPAIDDPVVARAMYVIRQNALGGINVEELLDHLTVSRATLERRFAKRLNRSPKDEILRLRLARAKQLLIETEYNLATIATMCGFKTAAHLSVTFKSHTKQSPGEFRTRSKIDM